MSQLGNGTSVTSSHDRRLSLPQVVVLWMQIVLSVAKCTNDMHDYHYVCPTSIDFRNIPGLDPDRNIPSRHTRYPLLAGICRLQSQNSQLSGIPHVCAISDEIASSVPSTLLPLPQIFQKLCQPLEPTIKIKVILIISIQNNEN